MATITNKAFWIAVRGGKPVGRPKKPRAIASSQSEPGNHRTSCAVPSDERAGSRFPVESAYLRLLGG
jgi:hypothetical protein